LPLSPNGDSKTQNYRFPCKIALRLKKVCYKFSLCENCQRQRQSSDIYWPNYPCKNDWWGTFPSTWKFGEYWPSPLHNADFQSIVARSASDVTASEKSSINKNRKFATRFSMSLTRIVYVDPKPPKWGSKMQCPKFKQQSAISSKRYEIGCQLLLITNRKLHTVFRLVPTSVTLHDLDRCNSIFFCFTSPNSIALQAY